MRCSNAFTDESREALPHYKEYSQSGLESVPSIIKPLRMEVVFGLAVVSGALSTVASWQVHSIVCWIGPGILFGLCVLLPWCRCCQISWTSTTFAVALAPVGYGSAMCLAAWFPHLFFVIGLAAGLPLLPLLITPHDRIRTALLAAICVGWVLGMPLVASCYTLAGGVGIWQMVVAQCLAIALQVDDPR